MSPALRFLYHLILSKAGKKSYHFPLGIYLYLTFRCNLNCTYCDGGSGVGFPLMKSGELEPAQWGRLLRKMGKRPPVLMLSGGEPLLYEGIREVIERARRAGFSFICLNTNGLLLEEDIVEMVDGLIISLDSLDGRKSDLLWGQEGATDRVLRKLRSLAGRKRPSLMVNSVILPDTIEDVEQVLDFCGSEDITFSAGPALKKTRPVGGLAGNPRYHSLVENILRRKRQGGKIAGSEDYYRAIRTFEPFDCHPLLAWRVYPNGELVFPCSRRNATIGTLLNGSDPLDVFRSAAGGRFFRNGCRESCALSCYMDTSFMTSRPFSLLREGVYRRRAYPRRRMGSF